MMSCSTTAQPKISDMNIDTQYTEDMRRQWTDATIRENNSTGKTYAIYNTDQNYT